MKSIEEIEAVVIEAWDSHQKECRITTIWGALRKVAKAIHEMLDAAAPPAPSVQQWFPIESAPKDGTPVLLHGRYWSDSQGEMKHPLVGVWVDSRERWECFARVVFGVRPTRWMPLPPIEQAGGKVE